VVPWCLAFFASWIDAARADALSAEQKARIARLAACYHDIDSSPIGL